MAGIHDGYTIPLEEHKDPDEYAWYGFIYDDYFSDDESILTSEWLINGVPILKGETVDGLTLVNINIFEKTTQVLVSGGIEGYRYSITNRIATTYNPIFDRSLYFLIQSK